LSLQIKMDISLQLGISYFFLLLVFIVVGHGEGQNECSELQCGPRGPAVRFPFAFKNRQQDHCGFPGFYLSCTHTNDTELELPDSVKLYVKMIDYKSQVIHLYDPDGCFPRQIQRFNLSSSPFRFKRDYMYLDEINGYSLFNCSQAKGTNDSRSLRISCLSGAGNQVYAIYRYDDISFLPMSSCRKMYDVQLILRNITLGDEKVLELKWNSPACEHCEGEGKNCRMKNMGNGSETECFPRQPKHTIGMYRYIYISAFIMIFCFLIGIKSLK
jgi:hypothetical protein